MEDARTPAGYFFAIGAVIGGAFLIPSFPIFIMVVCPSLLLGLSAYLLFKGIRRKRQSQHVEHNTLRPYSHAPVAVSQSRTVSGM